MAELKEALYYDRSDQLVVMCRLCPRLCVLAPGFTGFCNARKNIGGTLYATNYGETIGASLDPIEKKPLYHFRPGSMIYSLGANSCNLDCCFCQNFSVSRSKCHTKHISPDSLYTYLAEFGAKQVAFTYTEPITWYEYILDFAEIAKEVDIVLITNGYIEEMPLQALLPKIRAMNLDIKGASDGFYRDNCSGSLEPVLRTLRNAYAQGVHVEVTNLRIPGKNDAEEDIKKLVALVSEVDRLIPIHFSAYHPAYKLDTRATPRETVLNACRIASETMPFVYAGNISRSSYSSTVCPGCGEELVRREGSNVVSKLNRSGCPVCGLAIYGVFD